jgi:predicted dehydrogenase
VLQYPVNPSESKAITRHSHERVAVAPMSGKPSIGFIGAGNFAQGFLLPTLKNIADLVVVANQSGASAIDAQTKFGFKRAITDSDEVIAAGDVNTVFIATRHGSHAALATQALASGKNVFVEKPMAMNERELSALALAYETARTKGSVKFMVGFNRRFSQLVRKMNDFFGKNSGPKLIFYRVNAGPLPISHWTQDEQEGGGRIIGEVCHFIDTAAFLTGDALPKSVVAKSISSGRADMMDRDNVSITIEYDDGSVATIFYIANGDKAIPKEEIQVFSGGKSAIMKNFTELELWSGSGKAQIEKGSKKGHTEEVKAFVESLATSGEAPIPFDSLLATTLATFAARESLSTGEVVKFS